nr:retrotransposon protein, putative, Ty1-copia subclass [Tanacetum cinerariifolium]
SKILTLTVELPPNGKTVGSKWLFKKKTDIDGNVHIYKARYVAKGFTQTSRIDNDETFSSVADIRVIRILNAIAAYYDYEIWQMNVKTVFLNGYLNEEVYMKQPEGFVNPKYPNRVCKLKRSIYALKQASRQWNKQFDDEIKKFGFTQNRDEPCYSNASKCKTYLGICFAMKDLREAAYILGIKIYRDRSKRLIGLCQSAYIEKILNASSWSEEHLKDPKKLYEMNMLLNAQREIAEKILDDEGEAKWRQESCTGVFEMLMEVRVSCELRNKRNGGLRWSYATKASNFTSPPHISLLGCLLLYGTICVFFCSMYDQKLPKFRAHYLYGDE